MCCQYKFFICLMSDTYMCIVFSHQSVTTYFVWSELEWAMRLIWNASWNYPLYSFLSFQPAILLNWNIPGDIPNNMPECLSWIWRMHPMDLFKLQLQFVSLWITRGVFLWTFFKCIEHFWRKNNNRDEEEYGNQGFGNECGTTWRQHDEWSVQFYRSERKPSKYNEAFKCKCFPYW